MDPKQIVEAGYDQIAAQYLAWKDPADPTTLAALAALATQLPDGARVLDLGCGAGVPATQWLATRFATTGVDFSAQQLALARTLVPGATFIQADMAALDFAPASWDAVTAFYSLIHVPQDEQAQIVARIARWLRPGGLFLATWAPTTWEGHEADWQGWGAPMWWSHADAPTNLARLREVGFTILSADLHTTHDETWLWVLAQLPAQSSEPPNP
jgi:ubiquinone/menaquinone biosynthesis C-methylase UbiE